jgi:hypothetical protein
LSLLARRPGKLVVEKWSPTTQIGADLLLSPTTFGTQHRRLQRRFPAGRLLVPS